MCVNICMFLFFPSFHIPIYLFICLLKSRSQYVAQAGLELIMKLRLASNSGSSCLSLLNVWIIGVYHHAWLSFSFLSFFCPSYPPSFPPSFLAFFFSSFLFLVLCNLTERLLSRCALIYLSYPTRESDFT